MDIIALLKRHEGLRLRPYKDTVGKLTIGYGRNLVDKGITEREAEGLLTNDVVEVVTHLQTLPYWNDLDEVRQAVLIDMAVNLGWDGFLKFHRTLAAVSSHDYAAAAADISDSLAAREAPNRYAELCLMMSSGRWQEAE